MSAPLFVVLEGTDGSGTTTQGDRLTETLRSRGRTVVRTCEPSEGPIGQVLRGVLRDTGAARMDPVAVALLFAADRADHCARLIGPALARGDAVVCDRYLGSSLVFQVVDGQGGIDEKWVLSLNRAVLVPDLTVFLDVPEATAEARIRLRGKPLERFEHRDALNRVRRRYRAVFTVPPAALGCTRVIAGDRPADDVAADVWAALADVTPQLRTPVDVAGPP
ncbi:MAG: dTMP kinase [Myxococcales bacterium]|nr:dTMP kinase [Myxococcales bacterium]